MAQAVICQLICFVRWLSDQSHEKVTQTSYSDGNWVEAHDVSEETGDALSELVEGVSLLLSVHIVPLVGGELGDDGADLGDHTESIGLKVAKDEGWLTWLVLGLAEVDDVVEGWSEVAVLVVEEDKVDHVVSKLG